MGGAWCGAAAYRGVNCIVSVSPGLTPSTAWPPQFGPPLYHSLMAPTVGAWALVTWACADFPVVVAPLGVSPTAHWALQQ